MADVAFALITVVFFALAFGYVLLCDRLAERKVHLGPTASHPPESK